MSTSASPLALALFALACHAPAEPPAPAAPSDARMDWWREARFGMFVHWGLYALPAGEWQGQSDYGEWIRDSARIPREEYARFQGQFDPVRFDPDEWVALARAAGMKYLVITSKHHDGFALWDSAVSEWDMGGTPSRRDLLGELQAACRRGGVRFATYHSIMDWHHPDYLPRRPWETERSAEGADFERYERYLHAQVTELITRYRPGVMWFDGEWESTWNHERGVRLYELCRSLDPALIVNNRVDVHRGGMAGFSQASEAVGDFGTPEQEIPATGLPGVDWETCMTMNDHWGWNRADPDWKPVEVLVRNLIDVASKGGNYLLNVGPRADGTFPEQAIERLQGIGAWMAKHGDTIHGTSASPFGAFPWGRCTVKSFGEFTRFYLHVFERPADGLLRLPGLGNELHMANWHGAFGEGFPVRREGTDVVVELPAQLPDPIASVVQLCVWGEPIVYRAPEIVAESDIFVRPLEVRVESRSPRLELRYTLDGSDPSAASPRVTGTLELTDSSVVSARAFHRGEPVSSVTRREFRRVEPRPGRFELLAAGGFVLKAYEGDWDRLPDFASLAPVLTGSVREATLERAPRAEHVGLQFDGLLAVNVDDVYVFALASDDGADLWIDGERVIDNDGLHGTVERRGHVALGQGQHDIRVRWFNKTGGAELALRWAPLGGTLAPVQVFGHAR